MRRSLCGAGDGPNGDYILHDGQDHTFALNICGIASKRCMPEGWSGEYQAGVAIRSFGSAPPCNGSKATDSCLDQDGLVPACCTEVCHVLGAGAPSIALKHPRDPMGGLRLSHLPSVLSSSDPYWCMWNPLTGVQYPRTVVYELYCAPDVPTATPLVVVSNSTQLCA